MTRPDTNPLDESWPPHELETVCACPYCASGNRTLAYPDVRDWSFGVAAGRWSYWRCGDCHALFLDPRPGAASIARAYGRYYTHGAAPQPTWVAAFKQGLRNEYWSHRFATPVLPRLGLPRWTSPIFGLLKPWVAEPFGLRQLAELPRGVLIDVGCGNGDTVKLAAQLGWQALGIELDVAAVSAAQARGLNVIEGSYEALSSHAGQADCLICSHVIEHVHQPLELLRLLLAALKPKGVLLLSAPNAASHLCDRYGENWRGLEAPRHLAIPDAAWLIGWLRSEGFHCRQLPSHDVVTVIESERIARRALDTSASDVRAGKKIARTIAKPSMDRQDIVQIVCTRALP
ncbi:MAG: class I SAM-dependent methyltransferase [Polaromonas sp.]